MDLILYIHFESNSEKLALFVSLKFPFNSGDCNDNQECVCVDQELKGSHVKCVSDAVCKMYCQFDKKTRTGYCGGDYGWDCVCTDNDEENELRSF